MRLIAIVSMLAVASCGAPTDADLKRKIARDCGVAIDNITLWEVERDPKTSKPIAIAAAGIGSCLEDWNYRHGLMTKQY